MRRRPHGARRGLQALRRRDAPVPRRRRGSDAAVAAGADAVVDAAPRGAAPAAAVRHRRRGAAGARAAGARRPPTGRGGGQPREWYRGLPIPPDAIANFSRRNNTNYMETGVLSGLQLTAMFPNLVVENFYRRRRTRSTRARHEAPYGYVIPVQRDMTRVATLVNILRAQRIEIGQANAEIKIGDGTFPAGSYVDQARSALRPAREEPAREAELSRSQPHHLRRQRLDDGAGDAAWT